MIKYFLISLFVCSLNTVICADDEPEKNEVFWSPSLGDTWTYKIVVEVAKETSIPTDVEGQKVEKLEGKIRATYLQTAEYRGFLPISEDGKKAHAFYFSNGKQLEEIQYMLIQQNAVKVNFESHGKENLELTTGDELIIKIGKLRMIKLLGE